jgi:hypothetical protein
MAERSQIRWEMCVVIVKAERVLRMLRLRRSIADDDRF